MCRIAGIIDFNGGINAETENALVKMRDSMIHGGPDDAGLYISNDRKVAFAHRRLSIIDTSLLGHQPMSNHDKNIWITYNGEIYNFLELREELINKGYQFKSKTDTEVLVYGYEEWGIEKLLFRLRGMFVFVIHDLRNNVLVLAKDRFSIKPLYYYRDKNKFIFASEVKAMMRSGLIPDEQNKEATVKFLQLGSIPEPLTTVKNVFSVPAGHYIVLNENNLKIKQYWNIEDSFHKSLENKCSYEEAISTTSKLLKESINLHMISDVPLGVFLSGGTDSSAIVALASEARKEPLTTLSVIFDEKEYSEAQYARTIAEKYKTNHHELLLKDLDFINEIPNILNAMDQPTADGVNAYFVSKAAKEIGLTVVLSGIGGDEVFLGYPYYKNTNNLERLVNFLNISPGVLRSSFVNLATLVSLLTKGRSSEKISYLKNPTYGNAYFLYRGLFSPLQIQDLLGVSEHEAISMCSQFDLNNGFNKFSLSESLDLFDFNHYLRNQILKDVDFMGMRHSVEIRVPFLDHKLVEEIISLPLKYRLLNSVNKRLLVDSLSNKLPTSIVNRQKMGFTFPFANWIKKNHKMLRDLSFGNSNFNQEFVDQSWDDFLNGKLHWSRIWSFIVCCNI